MAQESSTPLKHIWLTMWTWPMACMVPCMLTTCVTGRQLGGNFSRLANAVADLVLSTTMHGTQCYVCMSLMALLPSGIVLTSGIVSGQQQLKT